MENKKGIIQKLKDRIKYITNSEESTSNNTNTSNNSMQGSNWRTNQVVRQFIVVSDLHGNIKKWNEIKKFIKYSPNTRFIILGDAMDRGNDGLKILREIKKYNDEGKVQYLPGNHDMFAFYMMRNINRATRDWGEFNLRMNGGIETIAQLKEFQAQCRNKQPNEFEELTYWLGSQPMQMKFDINENSYALAHAIFDDEIYQWDPEFNLEKALMFELTNNIYIYNKYQNIMSYRVDDRDTHKAPLVLPDDCTMIVGHTHQDEINRKYINYHGIIHEMIYIDTGLDEKNFAGLNLNGEFVQPLNHDRKNSKQSQKIR